MLNQEKIEVDVSSEVQEQEHWHVEIELVYVVEGTCNIQIEDKAYLVPQNEMILVNSGKKHSMMTEVGTLVCKIHFPYHSICNYIHEDYIYLKCNSVLENEYKYKLLKEYVRELLLAYIKEEQSIFLQFSTEYKILDYLLENFRVDLAKKKVDNQYWQNQRLSLILNYIYANYDTTISLTEIAERLYMTPSYISRFFKKSTGESFVQYVRRIRIQRVVEELINTQASVSRIAVNNGFSSPSAMNKDFKEIYGITPTDYRKQHMSDAKQKINLEERKKLSRIIQADQKNKIDSEQRKYYYVDTRKESEYRMWKNRILNVGPAYILDMANMQKQILTLKEKIDFEYVRIWSLFSVQLMIYGDEKKRTANFSKIDEIMDFCVKHRLKLFIDLGQRTNKAMASDSKMIYRKEEGILFQTPEEWEHLLEEFFQHIVKRYGRGVVGKWIYEFTFFLNERPYYESDHYSTKAVWSRGYQIVKNNIPEALVAGPGLIVIQNESFMRQIIEEFLKMKEKPDIFTTINLPYNGETEFGEHPRVSDEDFIEKQIHLVKGILREQEYKGRYYITEWSNSMANRNYIQDSCYRGAFMIKNVMQNYQEVEEMGIWYATDLLNVYYDSASILTGSSGLMTKDGICKPSLYALEFLNSMGCYLVEKGNNYLITKDERGDIQILMFHYKNIGLGYFITEEDSYRPDEIEQLFMDHDSMTIELYIEHFEEDFQYIIRQKIVNPDSGSVLDKWVGMECLKDLTVEDVTYLDNVSVPEVSLRCVQSKKGKIHLNIQMKPHEIRWISIKRQ